MSISKVRMSGSASQTMSGTIYSLLRQEIQHGEFAPESKLRIDALCKRYGATGTPIREALNQLTIEGFVTRLDQRGFFVAGASVRELRQLTDTRCWVEAIALRQALLHRSHEWEEALVLACHRLSRINRSTSAETFKENPEWEKAHRLFHMALIASCPSHWLVDFCGLLSDHAARYRYLSMSVIYPVREIAGEHRDLMETSIHGSPEDAVVKLLDHYRRTANIIETSNIIAAVETDTKPGRIKTAKAKSRLGLE